MEHYIIMGVAGSGKSTIGKILAERLKLSFVEGDDFHPESNILKMKDGIALNDEDRQPWLKKINSVIKKSKKSIILSCSSLKEDYRKILSKNLDDKLCFIYLNGSFDLINKRLQNRMNHFFDQNLLKSQFETLEIPKYGIHVNIDQSTNKIIQEIINKIENKNNMAEFGILGLGVMGKSLSRNFANNGFTLSLFNRHVDEVEVEVAKKFIQSYPELEYASGYDDLSSFINSLEKPRKILMMIKAGPNLDIVINEMKPHLDHGDIIIDGGNSHYMDTNRRFNDLKKEGIHYIGCGVSGGEEGALKGPSIMPGGDKGAYVQVAKYLETIAAKTQNNEPCCQYIGKGGAGHFVKMVHNGIEYAEMQLLAECYLLIRKGFMTEPDHISKIFKEWNSGELNSYLLEITSHILRRKEGQKYIIDLILDKAGNKGTGSWTSIAAAQLGINISMINQALFARFISSFKEERVKVDGKYKLNHNGEIFDLNIDDIKNAYQFARIINHHQGLDLIQAASEEYNWDLDLSNIAKVWTNGCIIRSKLMQNLIGVLKNEKNILLNQDIKDTLIKNQEDIKKVNSKAITNDYSIPCLLSAYNYFLSITNQQSTANIIQAQRDYFGAHTYKRKDDPTGKSHHTNWFLNE